MKKKWIIIGAVASILLMILLAGPGCQSSNPAKLDEKHNGKALIGSWEGSQGMTVRYKKDGDYVFIDSKEAFYSLIVVNEMGEVSGNLGKAVIKNGKVINNRGPLFRALNWATDYCIKADLEGYMFEGDTLYQKKISIPLNFSDSNVIGDVFELKGFDLYPMGSLDMKKVNP